MKLKKVLGPLAYVWTAGVQAFSDPFAVCAVTIDGDTLKDQTVTLRDRDTATQQRISIDKVKEFLRERIGE